MRVLFSGYAHVHFVCFRPLYERLVALPDVELFVSGGLREKAPDGYTYDVQSMYAPFGIPQSRMLTVEEIANEDFDVLFAANSKLILPRRVDTRIQIFHGISFRNRAVRPANMACDHYFMAGTYMHRRFVEAGLFQKDDARAVPIGFMKTDRLVNGDLDRQAVLDRYGLDRTRPVILYAPTGQKHNSLERTGEQVIRELKSTGLYHLLIKLHDHPRNRRIDWRDRLRKFEDDQCKVVQELDVIPLLFSADLLMSDASSVTNEFALLDRPMIYLDVPELMERARAVKDSMLDLDRWGRRGGIVARDGDDIVALVESSLCNRMAHSDERRAMVRDLFYNPGEATSAAMTWLGRQIGIGAERLLGAAR
ncbi:MAG: CDP-glycerol glycerophosphotransferase family protein [Planctomycetota bacterium]|nr:CDP-glycerol glycerophosphotransferase family protein [Planctomycetota bacterium]